MPRRVPSAPNVSTAERGEGLLTLRYEDVTQDGRLRLEPISHALGASVWRGALERGALVAALVARGIVPILSRLQVESIGGPIAVRAPLRCEGAYALLRGASPTGEPRLRLDMGADVHGVVGRTHGPRAPSDGAPILVGRVFAEHVLTRPFAPAEARRVTALPADVVDPSTLGDAVSAEASVDPPEDALDAEDEARDDAHPLALGLGHTDSNQHVNSLVYVRALEEAALRRFGALGWPTARLAAAVDLRYARPSFAGEALVVRLRAHRTPEGAGVVAWFEDASSPRPSTGPLPRARCVARMEFVD